MFTVTVELLTGRYVATQFNDRAEPEWPPHPARLFSAAVAAWADHGDMDDAEREALEWWEALEPPTIRCSIGRYELAKRSVVTHFVPVNDVSVVARDTARTYHQLVDAETALADGALEGKELAKATRRLDKARDKADGDSRKATAGVAPDDRLGILPQQRDKQGRTYPTIVPSDPTVDFQWNTIQGEPATVTSRHLEVLAGLVGRIPRLGHSSTPVAVSLIVGDDQTKPEVTLEPGTGRRSVGVRVTSPGQLASLIQTYEASGQATEPRTMPARVVPYRRPTESSEFVASTLGEHWIVLEPERSSRLMVQDIPAVAKTLRKALMSVSGENGGIVPEFVSGHQPRSAGEHGTTEPSTIPHLMVLGLPFAGYRHATGELMGMALVLPPSGQPTDADTSNWDLLVDVVRRFLDDRDGRLTFTGGNRPVRMVSSKTADLSESADIDRWTRPATTWVSVTPVALDRNPGRLGHSDGAKRAAAAAKAEQSVAVACERIGLPRPAAVEISFDPLVRGTRPVHMFPPARTGRLTRVQVHVRLRFVKPVRGPIVLGAGRFHGLGLFAPLGSERDDALEVVA